MLYFVRVQLDTVDDKQPNYVELHKRMAIVGYVRFLICRDGVVRRLSKGCYLKQSDLGLTLIQREAHGAARNYWPSAEVTTAMAPHVRANGLKDAPQLFQRAFKLRHPDITES